METTNINTGVNSLSSTNAPAYEETHAAHCLNLYLRNTADIYNRYTVQAIKKVTAAKRTNDNGPTRLDDATAWENLTFWASWQPEVKKALQAAARLVRKHDNMTPAPADIEAVTRDYVAYIIECAQYEINNNPNA